MTERASLRYALPLLACAAMASSMSHSTRETPGAISFNLTGTVRDVDSKEPLEGAYVVASYREVAVGSVAVRNRCVKTRGMFTGKDGRFAFPVEKLDGWSPAGVSAIKPSYARHSVAEPSRDAWKKQSAESYTGRDIFLQRQNPAKPDLIFGYGDEYCDHVATREAAAASVEFLKIAQSEKLKYGVQKGALDAGWRIIRRLEALPSPSSATTQ